jgi:signal transduction histidine kinase/GAF domain-containing protein
MAGIRLRSLSPSDWLQFEMMETPACASITDGHADDRRMAILDQYAILDTPRESAYDDITRLASQICATPIALISFIEKDRQWFKSKVGVEMSETPLGVSICAHALLENEMLVVPDTLGDDRFKDNPLVAGEPHLRFYAGAVLRSPGGVALGTLCVLDYVSRELTTGQLESLSALARQVMRLLELRHLVAAQSEALQEQRRLEESLVQNEQRFRFTTRATGITLFNQDTDLRYTWINNAIAGYSASSVLDKREEEIAHSIEDFPALIAAKRCVLASGKGTRIEVINRLASGQREFHALDIEPMHDISGAVIGLMGASVNITDRKLAEEQLAHAKQEADAANKAKDRFFAVLSHELRAPLAPALMITATLAGDSEMPERYREDIQLVHRNIELEASLIDSMLDLTRIANGKLELHVQCVDAHRLLSDSVAMCRTEAADKSVQVTFDAGAQKHWMNGDAPKLQQVFGNLLRNAVKFTPPGGRVAVRSANTVNGGLCIEVSDTGVGISPDVLPKVFEAFEQGRSAVTREYGGLGLGLAICKGIVNAHRGTISVASPGKDQGTTLTVELPTVAAPAMSDVGPLTPQTAHGPVALKILLVEDHVDTLRAMARLLRKLDHSVTTATCVVEALDAASKDEFDLVISDLGLPDGTGIELMRSLLERGPFKGIALTGYGMESDIDSTRAAGFAAHLTKPVSSQDLASVIQRLSR